MKDKDLKIQKYLLYTITVLVLILFFRGCSTNMQIAKLNKNIETISDTVSVLQNKAISSKELDLRLQIVSYETSYRLLYNSNEIVRTTKRPDDVMNDYKVIIDNLREKLKNEK